jgi:hypothetical protein
VQVLSGAAHRLCDVNSSGTVTVLDALLIARYAVGLQVVLACAPRPRSWVEVHPATAPAARYGHALAYDSTRNEIVLFGGSDGWTPDLDLETWVYDGSDWRQV